MIGTKLAMIFTWMVSNEYSEKDILKKLASQTKERYRILTHISPAWTAQMAPWWRWSQFGTCI